MPHKSLKNPDKYTPILSVCRAVLVFRPAEISAVRFVYYLLSVVFLHSTFSGELSSGLVPAAPQDCHHQLQALLSSVCVQQQDEQ